MPLGEFVAKGRNKYQSKLSQMKSSYVAAASRAQSNYAQRGFGPTRTQHYQTALSSYAVQNYEPKADWVERWATNYQAKMSE